MTPDTRILLAEDDSCLASLLIMALEKMKPPTAIVHVSDGVEALDYLHMRGRFQSGPPYPPSVVLLDLKMPRIDGLEVLRAIKNDERLKMIPVVMLTASQDDHDLQACYQAGANAYVIKPVVFDNFMEAIRQLGVFWTQINCPPPSTGDREADRREPAATTS